MPIDIFKLTAHFNDQVCGLQQPDRPTSLGRERLKWFIRAAQEELEELEDAASTEDQVDAILDLIYFAAGRMYEMGINGEACFEVIHTANMQKRQGELAKRPGSKGHDAVKPPEWQAPDLRPYLIFPEPEARRMVGYDRGQVVESLESLIHDTQRPKILVLGYARHGKDTAADLMTQNYDLRFVSSSLFCAEHIIMPHLGALYKSVRECFEDRSNNRAEWYNLIRDYNRPDATALGRAIFEDHDIYCGLRSKAEFNALKNTGAFDVSIWVDGSDRHPPEAKSSCTVEPWMADYVVDNNGSMGT